MFKSLQKIVILAAVSLFGMLAPVMAQDISLPQRDGVRPKTTNGVPHIQKGLHAIPALQEKMLSNVANLADVTLAATRISLPGAVGFQLNPGLALARPDAIVGGREFAHMHPDGSLHATLAPKVARAAVNAGWATPHPWANQRPGWEGFVMIYTPTTDAELDVVLQLIHSSYNFVTGRNSPEAKAD